jgi:hypothetical protein
MSKYEEFINAAPLIPSVETTLTTGDLDYDGTAFEVTDKQTGAELFHVVVDVTGERQLLLFGADGNFRVKLSDLEKIIHAAKEKVHRTDASN